LELFL